MLIELILSRDKSELDNAWDFHDLSAYVNDIPFEISGLDRVPILLFIVKQLGFEYFIFEGDCRYILISLFEKVSTSRGKVDIIKIEESADQEKESQSADFYKLYDAVIVFVLSNDSGVYFIHLSWNKSECPHALKRIKNL